MRIFLYLCAIVLANVITANFAPLQFGVFIIPYGSFLIGATFILRDLVQNKYGKKDLPFYRLSINTFSNI